MANEQLVSVLRVVCSLMFESTDWKNCCVKIDGIRRAFPHDEHIKSHYEAASPA